tara:strand:- start:333 stop:497 length:165 start_codon:yes stop_codon:yes gene_type:complete
MVICARNWLNYVQCVARNVPKNVLNTKITKLVKNVILNVKNVLQLAQSAVNFLI